MFKSYESLFVFYILNMISLQFSFIFIWIYIKFLVKIS